MGMNEIRPSVSTRDAVYMKLREQILSLELPPGTPLSENETSILFQVSRTPVRESFLRLAQEGLVQVLPQRGTFVSLIDTALVDEARFMREHLESAVIQLACRQFQAEVLNRLEANVREQLETVERKEYKSMFELDQQFHRLLFEGCGKLGTWNAMQQLSIHLNRSRMLMLTNELDWHHLYDQHRQMVDAIKGGDSGQAAQVMRQHLHLNITDQTHLKEKFPNYYK